MGASLFCLVPAIVLIAMAAFTGLTVLLAFLMLKLYGQVSGLTKLAEQYPVRCQPQDRLLTRHVVQVGPVRYRRRVDVSITNQGLYVWVRSILSQYAPVLIPWSEMRPDRETILYSQKAMRLFIGDPLATTIAVLMHLFRLMQPHLRPAASP